MIGTFLRGFYRGIRSCISLLWDEPPLKSPGEKFNRNKRTISILHGLQFYYFRMSGSIHSCGWALEHNKYRVEGSGTGLRDKGARGRGKTRGGSTPSPNRDLINNWEEWCILPPWYHTGDQSTSDLLRSTHLPPQNTRGIMQPTLYYSSLAWTKPSDYSTPIFTIAIALALQVSCLETFSIFIGNCIFFKVQLSKI